MSKHVGRKERWSQVDAKTHVSDLGTVAFRRGAWYARLVYRLLEPPGPEGGLPRPVPYDRWIGPFKRPRDAMVALEREVTALRNRHGEDFRIGATD
jgi:hypothetical protein